MTSSPVTPRQPLKITEALAPRMVYPAHGAPIEDIDAVIAMFREQFSMRQKRIMDILVRGDFTAYHIARTLFPEIRGARLPLEIYLAVSEVYTHLQVILEKGSATQRMKGGVLYFSLTCPAGVPLTDKGRGFFAE